MQQAGINAVHIVPEETDMPLAERVDWTNQANAEARKQCVTDIVVEGIVNYLKTV